MGFGKFRNLIRGKAFTSACYLFFLGTQYVFKNQIEHNGKIGGKHKNKIIHVNMAAVESEFFPEKRVFLRGL